jgi:succinate dehydrogenase/fumarate reductase flavoprotein subunit
MKQGYYVVVAGAGNAAFCAALAARERVGRVLMVAGLPPGRYSGVAPARRQVTPAPGRPAPLGQAKPEG